MGAKTHVRSSTKTVQEEGNCLVDRNKEDVGPSGMQLADLLGMGGYQEVPRERAKWLLRRRLMGTTAFASRGEEKEGQEIPRYERTLGKRPDAPA